MTEWACRGMDRRALLVGAATLGTCAAAPGAGADTPAGQVIAVSGVATAVLNAARRSLVSDAQVFVGDRISTSAGARASLKLGRSTDLRLGESARVTIDRFLMEAGGVITLGAGPALIEKDPQSAGQRLDIRSPYGLIAVRGTRFFAGPSNGVFGVFVERGQVALSGGGRQVLISAGEGSDVSSPGGQPSVARPWGAARIAAALASVR
ncbi:MAG: FecR family protein [Beijerinckiaceae bacterium]